MSDVSKNLAMRWAALLLGASLSACSTSSVVPTGTRFMVKVPRAQFYKYGPAQSFGADFVLSQGQKVILLERSFGFSRVMTEDGNAGWIASDDITLAPPEPRSKTPNLASRRGSGSSGGGSSSRLYSAPVKNSNVQPVPGDPLFDMSDLPPPPLPEGPEPEKPKFRVNVPKPK